MSKVVVTKPAPEFSAEALVGKSFKTVSLSDYKGKWLVFFFYPLDWTFVCPTEIIAFSERVADFQKVNTELLAASVDSVFSHLSWVNASRAEGGLGDINFPILSDQTHDISKDYGVLMDTGFTMRGLFIIDPKGNVRHVTLNDPPVGRNVDEVLRVVQAYQFTDEHGEVCPAGWTPGAKTMKPDPEGSKAYFQEVNK